MKTVFENGMFAVVADPGMVIKYENGYCHKLYRKTNDFSDCTEVDETEVPVMDEEPTAEDYEATLAEMGVEV
jgi:hypothetical protein